jgi:hypothetical protein
MSELKLKKEVKGSAIINLGPNGSLTFDEIQVYINDWHETELILSIVDKNNSNNQIQVSFDKPEAFVEKKDVRIEHIRKQASDTLELTKGFTPEQRDEKIKTMEELANYILEITK